MPRLLLKFATTVSPTGVKCVQHSIESATYGLKVVSVPIRFCSVHREDEANDRGCDDRLALCTHVIKENTRPLYAVDLMSISQLH